VSSQAPRPMFPETDWQPVIEAIRTASHIVLTTHCNPDGDGIGSQLALFGALQAAGKHVRMHNRDGVPRIYEFLEHAADVTRGDWPGDCEPDVIISLDCGAKSRLGMPDKFFTPATLINIDHHASNQSFGDINIVDARYCATGAMIFDLLLAMQVPLNASSAAAMYAAVLTDTASFRLASATADVYRMAASLIEAGAEPWPISVGIYESRHLAGLKVMTACLNTLELHDGGRSAWVYVDRDMYEQSGADVEDTEGLIDYARSIDGVEVAVFVRIDESRDGCWKVSFRGKIHADVGSLAAGLGGGGHRHAAGCLMRGSLEEVNERLRSAVSTLLG